MYNADSTGTMLHVRNTEASTFGRLLDAFVVAMENRLLSVSWARFSMCRLSCVDERQLKYE